MTKEHRIQLGRGLLAAVFLTAMALPAQGQVNNWTGANSTDWFDPGNWSFGSVPTINDAVQINTTSPNPTVVDGAPAEVGVINIASTQTGHLSIVNGGTLTSGFEFVNDVVGQVAGSEGTVVVSGVGSAWMGDSLLFGRGVLTIEDEGAVHYGAVEFAGPPGAVAELTVTDAGSHFMTTEGVVVADEGVGTLTVSQGGLVEHTGGPILVASSPPGTGTINVGAAAGDPPVPPGMLDAVSVVFGAGSGTLNFNHTADDYEFSPDLFGAGEVNVLAGTTVETADASTFSGATHVVGGTLRVNGLLEGSMEVQAEGRLEGLGTVGGTTNHGTVAPGESIGTLNLSAGYIHTTTGRLEVEIEPGGGSDLLNIAGTANLQGGTVSVLLAAGDYVPGTEFPILIAAQGVSGAFDNLVQDDPSVELELVVEGDTVLLRVALETQVFTPVALGVDMGPVISDGNEVFEPGERVEVAPAWRNDGEFPQLLAGTASNFTGPDGPSYTLVLDQAEYGEVDPGVTASCLDAEMCYQMDIGPPGIPRPVLHWDAAFDETLSDETVKTWTLHVGDSFADVPRVHPFYRLIETLLHRGATSGCGPGSFCPEDPATRAEAAVFLLRGLEGPGLTPLPCVAGEELFDDVPADDQFCAWIEELAARGITSGCGDGNYCPDAALTRAQTAPLLLRTLEGAGYSPPPCSGVLADVPCPSTFADWIEDLFARGITAGCGGGNYCPAASVSRARVTVFLTLAFDLVLYGP